MNANRSQLFSRRMTTVTNAYTGTDQSHKMPSTMNNLKVIVAGGAVELSLIGPDAAKVDLRVNAGETMDFAGLQFDKLAWRQAAGGITELRVVAWT